MPYLIERIEDRDGKVLYQANPPRVLSADAKAEAGEAAPERPLQAAETQAPGTTEAEGTPAPAEPVAADRILDERTAFIMTSMLQDVIRRGTGRRALALERNDLAGKTGTTNDSFDSWFSGYNADLVTTVWAGFDQPQSLGRHEYGGTVALPIWMTYMGAVLKDQPEHLPAEPDGLITIRIDPVSGRAASPGTPNAYFELFKSEDTPPPMSELDSDYQAPGSPLPAPESAPLDLF